MAKIKKVKIELNDHETEFINQNKDQGLATNLYLTPGNPFSIDFDSLNKTLKQNVLQSGRAIQSHLDQMPPNERLVYLQDGYKLLSKSLSFAKTFGKLEFKSEIFGDINTTDQEKIDDWNIFNDYFKVQIELTKDEIESNGKINNSSKIKTSRKSDIEIERIRAKGFVPGKGWNKFTDYDKQDKLLSAISSFRQTVKTVYQLAAFCQYAFYNGYFSVKKNKIETPAKFCDACFGINIRVAATKNDSKKIVSSMAAYFKITPLNKK